MGAEPGQWSINPLTVICTLEKGQWTKLMEGWRTWISFSTSLQMMWSHDPTDIKWGKKKQWRGGTGSKMWECCCCQVGNLFFLIFTCRNDLPLTCQPGKLMTAWLQWTDRQLRRLGNDDRDITEKTNNFVNGTSGDSETVYADIIVLPQRFPS